MTPTATRRMRATSRSPAAAASWKSGSGGSRHSMASADRTGSAGGRPCRGGIFALRGGPMLLEGKHGLVLGIANKRSIAWGIAQSVARAGARLAVTYQGERLEENVREL